MDNLSFNFDFSTFQVEAALTSDGEKHCVHITQQNWYMQGNNYNTSENEENTITIPKTWDI
jgi:hypothetical protein